jgi:hypothetical protein
VSEANVPAAPATPRFAVGDRVRVVRGTADPNYPDIPLGGWAGLVRDIDPAHTGLLYLVEWSDQTLAAAPAVWRRRCDRDDLEFERAWLREADIEADSGGPVPIEQPTKLTPRPLNPEDPADRARQILGLSSDDEWPPIEEATLGRFYSHLKKKVRLPFTAGLDLGGAVIGPGVQPVLVTRFLSAKQSLEVGHELRAEVEHPNDCLEVPLSMLQPLPGDRAADELKAYLAWLEQHRPRPEHSGPAFHPLVPLALGLLLLAGLVGAVLEAVQDTHLPAAILACLGGVVGALFLAKYELIFRATNRLPPNIVGGLLLGLVLGVAVGGALGALLGAYIGSIPGAIAGTVLGALLGRTGRGPGTVAMTFVGACVGAAGAAFVLDSDRAVRGLWQGMVGGVVAGAVIAVGVVAYLRFTLRGRR